MDAGCPDPSPHVSCSCLCLSFVLISMSQLLHLCPFLFSFAALFHDLPEASSLATTALKSHKFPVTWNDPLSSPPLEHAVWALVIPHPLPWLLPLFSWLSWPQFCFSHLASLPLLQTIIRAEAWRGRRVGLCSDPLSKATSFFQADPGEHLLTVCRVYN